MLQLWSKKMLSTIWCTFKIIPTPVDAIVTINGEVRNSVTLLEGSEVSWSVSANDHEEQTGTLTLNEDAVMDVVLEEKNDPLYYCYRAKNGSTYNYIYVKSPLGSNANAYSTSTGIYNQATSSSQLTDFTWVYGSITTFNEVYITTSYNLSYDRYVAGDLYT